MRLRPPRSTLSVTLLPYTTLFRSPSLSVTVLGQPGPRRILAIQWEMAQLHLEQRIEKLHQRRQPIRSTDDRIARHAMQQGELAFDSFRVSQDCRFEAVIALHPDQYFQRRIRLGDLEKMGVQAIEFIRRNPTVYLERLDFVVARNAVDGLRVRGIALTLHPGERAVTLGDRIDLVRHVRQ